MDLRIDRTTREPASGQIRRMVAAAVEAGRFLPGERLPTIRDLAARLRVAPNTVAKAYRELEADGVVVGRGRRGTFVVDRSTRTSSQEGALRDAADRYARETDRLGVDMQRAVAEARSALARRRRDPG